MSIVSKLQEKFEEETGSLAGWDALEIEIIPDDPIDHMHYIAKKATAKIPCDACGEDVRKYSSQAFADVDFLDGRGPVRWFRLCESCAIQAKSESDVLDTRIQFLQRQWPVTDTQWRNGFIRATEEEDK